MNLAQEPSDGRSHEPVDSSTDKPANKSADESESHSSAPFVWPPVDHSSIEKPRKRVHSDRKPPIQIRSPNRLIESIEVELMGRTSLSFEHWVNRTGWTPENQNEYCWRCAGSIGAHESDGDGCAQCRSKSLPWERAVRLGRYESPLREEVLSLKFRGWRPAGTGLGKHLGLALSTQLKHAQIDPTDVVLVPVPMHRYRRMARGVDHTMLLCRSASKASGCRTYPVVRTRYRPEQVGLSMTARAKNIRDSFFVQKSASRFIRRSHDRGVRLYIMIDDVRTTGATMVAACRSLRSALNSALIDQKQDNSDGDSTPKIWMGCIVVAGETNRKQEREHSDAH
jgi:predicted amidophosphoribosyltransferase